MPREAPNPFAVDPGMYVEECYRRMEPEDVIEHLGWLEGLQAGTVFPRFEPVPLPEKWTFPDSEEGDWNMLNQLKIMNVDRIDLDEAVALEAFAHGMRSVYDEYGLEAPDWFVNSCKTLATEIARRREDNLRKALAQAEAEAEALKTQKEKRTDNAARIARLRKELGED